MQRLPFPHLVAQRYEHGESSKLPFLVRVQNDVPDELHKKGILHQRTPEAIKLKRYEPVWAMVHKLRRAMATRMQRYYTLEGMIELDEGYWWPVREIERARVHVAGELGKAERCGDGRKHPVGRYRNGQKGEACALFQGQGTG